VESRRRIVAILPRTSLPAASRSCSRIVAGVHASQGEFTKYLSEGPDGYDTLEWITQQEWSTGRVGTMGLSYRSAHRKWPPRA